MSQPRPVAKNGRFDELGLPQSGSRGDAPERQLVFRRIISGEVGGMLRKVIGVVNATAPGVLTTTNMWYYSPLKYFDYGPIAYAAGLPASRKVRMPLAGLSALIAITRS